MNKEDLIKRIDNYLDECEGAETWFNSDLVEKSLSLLEKCKEYLQNEN